MNADRLPVVLTDPRGWLAYAVDDIARALTRLAHRLQPDIPAPDDPTPRVETLFFIADRLGIKTSELVAKMEQ